MQLIFTDTGITRKSNVIKTSNRSTEANLKEDNYDIGKTSSRLASIQKRGLLFEKNILLKCFLFIIKKLQATNNNCDLCFYFIAN